MAHGAWRMAHGAWRMAHGTLRGGGAVSLRHGAQAKSWAQRPLAQPIAVPAALISPR
jgi:hypothetical protein